MIDYRKQIESELDRSESRLAFWRSRQTDGIACRLELQREEWFLAQLVDELGKERST